MSRRLALVLALIVVGHVAPAADEHTAFLVRRDGRGDASLWKASSSGTITLVQASFGAGVDGGYFNYAPAVSPDGKLLVFAKLGDLWIRDFATAVEYRITDAARPYDGHHAGVTIEITGWSPRGDQLLYEVVRPDRFPRDSCGGGPVPIVREAPYGNYLFDVASRTSRAISLPGRFHAWLSDQELIAGTDPIQYVTPHLRVKIGASEQTPLPFPTDRFCGQLAPDADGSLLLASCTWDQKSQLMELSLSGGQLRSITAEGEFAEFQSPTFSPTGRRIAWTQRARMRQGRVWSRLVVDSMPVFTCEALSYRWIDDETLLCTCANELFVIDASTAEVKGTKALAVADR